MVVGVWELVKFLWSHPFISCLVLLLFSPPFFPIIVYFSPVLLCTGLVAIAMVSMSMGESVQSEDWRNGTGRLHDAGVNHRVEVPVKPARESWLEWMKKKEEKAKAWVDSRFLNQEKWQFQNTSVLASEEEPDLVVDNNESDVEHRIPTYKAPTPIITKRVHTVSPLQANRDVLPPVAEVAKVSNNPVYSSVSAADDIKSIPRAEVRVEDRLFTFPNLEDQSLATLEGPQVEEEVTKGNSDVPSPLKEKVLLLVVANVRDVAKNEIPSVAPKVESLLEQPTTECRSEPSALDERVIEVPLVSSNKEVPPLVGINESFSKGLKKKTQERIAEAAAESIASEESSTFLLDRDQVTKVEKLTVGNEKVVEEARNFQTGADLHGGRVADVEVLVCPEFSFLGEDQNASPETEGETKTSVFSQSNRQDAVIQPTQRFTATEKIIFVDEPSKFTRVQGRSMVAETLGQMEAPPIQNAFGQIIVVDTALQENIGFPEEDSKSPKDGLDENIESHGKFPPLTATSITTSAAVLVQRNLDTMALVKSQSDWEEVSLPESSNALVPSIPYHPTNLELLPEQMEPMMSLISSDSAAQLTSFGGSVLDKSYSLSSTFSGDRDECDDLTARFNALKKSMSLHTTRRWEEPIPISLRPANKAAANAVVPVYVPDMVSRVGRDNLFLESSLVFPEKKSLTQPRLGNDDVESLEALTARLQKKFTLNLRNDVSTTLPPSRPVPALPSIAAAPTSVESDNSAAIATASLESDESIEVTGSLVPLIDAVGVKGKLKNTQSKKALTSFLSRRRERLSASQLVDSFPISDEGERRGSKLSSGPTADTATSAEIVAADMDEGSTTTGRHLKERMMSPLKKVFSMDANADQSSSKKIETGGVSSVKSSAVRDKQSVIDRSKGRIMKLFSNEGGLTKVELAGSDTISLAKLKLVSHKPGDQSVELTEEHNEVVENVLIPSEVVHGTENVGTKSQTQEELPSIEAGAPPAKSVEDLNSILEPTPSTLTEERVPVTTLDGGGPDNFTEGRESRVLKSTSGKKFVWSWRNSQKSVSHKIGEQNVGSGGEQNELGFTAMSMPTIPTSSTSTEVVHGFVEKMDVQSENQELPGIEAPAALLETAERLDDVSEPIPSSSTMSPPTLENKESGDCPKARGKEVTKSSSEKKFGWTWKKKKQFSEPLDDAPPLMDQSQSKDDDGISLSGKEGFEVVQGMENVDVESEYQELPSTEEAAPPPLPDISKELDDILEQIPASLTKRSGRVPKPSSDKKFEWSWTKKKRSSEPIDDASAKVDHEFRSQDDEVFPLSRKGSLEEESREIIMSPLTSFHSSSAIMSLVTENSRVHVPVPWDENHSSECRFSPLSYSNSNHRDSSKPNSSPHKKSSISWWSPKTPHSKNDPPVAEKVVSAENTKVSTSWWSRKQRRADFKASASSSADISSPTKLSSASKNDSTEDMIARERSRPLSPSSTTTTTDNNNDDILVENLDRLPEGDGELSVDVRPRPRHRRERSDSLPTASSGGKFSHLHGRQTSMSEITLPRTPELSPALSSGRATDYNSITGGMSSSSTSFSMPRTEDDLRPEHVKRSSDSISARSIEDKVGWRRISSSTTPLPTSPYQIRPSSVRMLDLANEQLKGGSPFHRCDLDVSGRGLYKNPPSAAEIRITDKLKAPLEEILSLLAVGDNDEQHRLTTVHSYYSTVSAIDGGDGVRQASSSSSSEQETSSEEEWSAKSDNEDELQEQQQQQQFTLLPPSGRIRRRLPPYVFSREEPTAN